MAGTHRSTRQAKAAATRGRTHIKRRQREPYRWLGAGALTLGLGAAMANGTAIAAAHPGNDTTTTHDTTKPAQPHHHSNSPKATAATPAAASTPTAVYAALPTAATTHTHQPAAAPAPTAAVAVTAAGQQTAAPHVSAVTTPTPAPHPVTAMTPAAASTPTAITASNPILNFVAGVLSTLGLNTPTAPVGNPLIALIWTAFRKLETQNGAVPQVGTPTMTTNSTTGVVTGSLNITEPINLPLTYKVATAPVGGTVTLASTGTFTYTPTTAARQVASTGGPTTDTSTVTASDGLAATNQTVTVPITPIADTPSAPTALLQSSSANGVVTGQLSAIDPAGKPLTYNAVANGGPTNGTLSVTANGAYTYTPTLLAQQSASIGGASTDSFSVTASNGTYTSAAGTISVPITPVDDIPSTPQTGPLAVSNNQQVSGAVSSSDPAGAPLTYTVSTNASNGSVTLNATSGEFTYTPSTFARQQYALGAPISDSFAITATNGTFVSAADTVTVAIAAPDIPTTPVDNGNQIANPDGQVTGQLTATDPAGKTLTYTGSTTTTSGGAITVTPTGAYTYWPNINAQLVASLGGPATDTFTVTATNGTYTSTPGTITVPIAPRPDAPINVTDNGHQSTTANGIVTGQLTATDNAAITTGKTLTYTATSTTTTHGGTITVTPNGAYTYTPTTFAQQNAAVGGPTTDTFTVTATNGTYTSAPGTITVPITATADVPVAGAPQVGTPNPATGTVTGAAAFTDPAGKTLTYSLSPSGSTTTGTSIGGGAVSLNAGTGTFTYTPTTAQRQGATTGTQDTFTVTATNGVRSVTETVTVAVSPVQETTVVGNPITGFVTPRGVVVSPDGTTAYVTNSGNGTVSVINTTTDAVTATIGVGSAPRGVAISPDGATVYVANQGSGTVSVINTATDAVTTTITVGTGPLSVAFSPNGATAYVVNRGSGTVSVINTVTDTVTTTIGVGTGTQPTGIAVSNDGTTAYVTNTATGTVSAINTATNTVTTTITVGTGPQSVTVSADGQHVYVGGSGSVSVITAGTANVVTDTITVGGTGPVSLALSPDNTKLYVTNQNGGTLSVVSLAQATPVIAVGLHPSGVAVSPNGTTAYVVNSASGTVSVINTATNIVTATIAVDTGSTAIAVSPDGTRLYVTEGIPSGGIVTVIDTATNTVTGTITLPAGAEIASIPNNVAVSADGSHLYIAIIGGLATIDTATNTMTFAFAALPSTGSPTGLAFSPSILGPKGAQVLVTYAGFPGSIWTYDANGASGGFFGLGGSATAEGVAFSPDGSTAYIAQNNGTVTVVNNTLTVTATIAVGAVPTAMVAGPDGTKLYVLNTGSDTVSVVDTATNTVTGTILVGSSPSGVAVSPDGTKLYVTLPGDDTVSVITL